MYSGEVRLNIDRDVKKESPEGHLIKKGIKCASAS